MDSKQTAANVVCRTLVKFEVTWPGPLNLPLCLEGFRRWGYDGLDYWDGEMWVRTLRLQGRTVPFACRVTGSISRPKAEITVPDAAQAAAARDVIQSMIVTAPEKVDALLEHDAVIAGLERRFTGLRPILQGDLFTNLIRSISAQQVNLQWAATTRQRLAQAYGDPHCIAGKKVYSLHPQHLAGLDVANLRELQFTTRKAEYIIDLARSVLRATLSLEQLRTLPDGEVIDNLTRLRGIGRWTAEWFLARGLGRPCVVAGDLGVRKAVGAAYLQGTMPSEEEVRRLTAHWGAAAGVAQQLVLHALNQGV